MTLLTILAGLLSVIDAVTEPEREESAERWLPLARQVVKGARTTRKVLRLARREAQPFQLRVHAWMRDCFEQADSLSQEQRAFRFIEEALELGQAAGTPPTDVQRLMTYVYGRPVGALPQEIGGVMVTLAGLATVAGHDLDRCAEAELDRCHRNTEKIRAKDRAKPKRSPLPGPSEAAAAAADADREMFGDDAEYIDNLGDK